MKSTFYKVDKISVLFSPRKILLGVGAAKQVGKEARSLGGKRALIVTDEGVMRAGLLQGIQESLEAEKLQVGIFDKVESEPPARVVDECVKLALDGGYDLLIGVGGGSSLDTTKGVSIVVTNKGKIMDYIGTDTVPKEGIPKILIPTTAGTGSEVTRALVITDETANTKKVVFDAFLLADVAIVDPLLALPLPPEVTANTGIDALVHAIESYVCVNATPFSNILAIEAISLIAENLPTAYAKGSTIEARFNMAFAALIAGSALASAGAGAVHGLAYPIGTEYHLPHGRANAIMLPHVMDYNKLGNLRKFAQIAQAMGENIEALSTFEAAGKAVEAVKRLLGNLGVSFRLTDYKATESDLPKLVKGGMVQSRLFAVNPRDLTEKEVESIYQKALGNLKAQG